VYFKFPAVENLVLNLNRLIYKILIALNKGAKAPPPQVFRKHKKCPFSGGKVPFAYVKHVVQIAFFMIAIIFPSENTKNAHSPVVKCPLPS
jgi:hypothetical protein